MNFLERYIKTHKSRNLYLNEQQNNGYTSFCNCHGWTDHLIENNLVYSHRTNEYTKKTFTEGLHIHDYYELIIYAGGNINYIMDNYVINPQPYSAVWFCPEQMHTATLLSPSEYNRYVFYFSSDFFTINNTLVPITNFMNYPNSNILTPSTTHKNEIKNILNKIDAQLESNNFYSGLLIKAFIIELFGIFNNIINHEKRIGT